MSGHCCDAVLEEASLILLEFSRLELEFMLKGKKSWIAFLNAAQTRGLVQVDPATGTKATAFSPAKGLKRHVQQDILAQEPGQIKVIALHHIDVHLGSTEFDLLVAKGFAGSDVQNCELIGYGNRDRL